ncbi:MAG: PAS domain S-box protein [Planctomycetaceae bacterium]|nr:PAS domain S-box protein [Planctomycetaceae bacterium]
MAILTIESGSLSGTRRDVVRDVIVLGRDNGCDIVFTEDTVSRKHARIVRGSGGCYLEDLQSRNGTFLNGGRVHGPVRLRDGDSVQLYDVALTFSEGSATPAKSTGSGIWLNAPETTSIGHRTMHGGETVAEIDLSSPEGTWVKDRADVRLQAVLDVSRHLRSWLDLPELYERILDCLVRIFPQLELACVLRLDQDGGRLVLDAVRSSGGSDPQTAGPIMQSIVRKAFMDEKALLSVDVARDARSVAGSVHEDEHRCVMCAPLLDSLRAPLGALYLDTADLLQPFGVADLDVLACVALLTSQAVEQATLHNARYRAAVNLSTDAIITFDADGRMESFNPAAIDLFGYDASDMRNVNIRDLTPALAPLLAPSDDEAAAALLWTFRRSTEALGRRADGSAFPVRLSVGEVRLGGHQLFTASVHDITDSKRVEQSLKRSKDELERAVEQRTGYVRLQQEIASIANEADTVERAFQSAFDEIRKTTHWPLGHVYVRSESDESEYVDAGIWSAALDDDFEALQSATQDLSWEAGAAGRTAVGRVIASRRACRAVGPAALAGDPRAALLGELGLQNVLAFPVFVGDDVAAVMEFFAPTEDVPDDELMSVMAHVGMQLGRVMERRHLQKELVDAVWDQQRDFGLELHDTIGQELAGIGMLADSLARKLAEQQAAEMRQSRELADMLQHAKQGVRRLAKGLLPVEVDADGLKSALEELGETTEQRCGIPVDVWCDERLQLDDNMVATHLFRIAQEAVTNAVRHADAQHLVLKFARNEAGDVELSVSDDGSGMRVGERREGRGVGLKIMKYRAQVIDGHFEISSGAEGGTVVACRLRRSNHHVSENGRRARQRTHRR